MVKLDLDRIFDPKSTALIGASDEKDSVGYILMRNLTYLGYKGRFYPVNIHKTKLLGFKTYQTVGELPEIVDLAIARALRRITKSPTSWACMPESFSVNISQYIFFILIIAVFMISL